jgi:competence factor
MRKLINKKKGFTLVELLVVVAILGILMLLALPRFMDSTKGSKVRTYESNVRTLLSMANQYSADKAGVFKDIENSDVSAMATKLLGKPDGATYVISATNLTATLDLAASNVGTGTYKIVYEFATGKFTEVDPGTLPTNIKASFTKDV